MGVLFWIGGLSLLVMNIDAVLHKCEKEDFKSKAPLLIKAKKAKVMENNPLDMAEYKSDEILSFNPCIPLLCWPRLDEKALYDDDDMVPGTMYPVAKNGSNIPSIKLNGEKYKLHHIRIIINENGSEHQIDNNNKDDGEIQLIHYHENINETNPADTMRNETDMALNIIVMLKTSKKGKSNPLIEYMNKLSMNDSDDTGTTTTTAATTTTEEEINGTRKRDARSNDEKAGIQMDMLLPKEKEKFYMFKGTTHDCLNSENLVFSEKMWMTEDEKDKFMTLHKHGEEMEHNGTMSMEAEDDGRVVKKHESKDKPTTKPPKKPTTTPQDPGNDDEQKGGAPRKVCDMATVFLPLGSFLMCFYSSSYY